MKIVYLHFTIEIIHYILLKLNKVMHKELNNYIEYEDIS